MIHLPELSLRRREMMLAGMAGLMAPVPVLAQALPGGQSAVIDVSRARA